MNILSLPLTVTKPISARLSVSDRHGWDAFADRCDCSYRCYFSAARLNDTMRFGLVRRLEIFWNDSLVERKIGQCTAIIGRSLSVICDQIQLLPYADELWPDAMAAVLAVLGPGYYQYGSEWSLERPRSNDMARLATVKTQWIRQSYLEAVEFGRWPTWNEYWKAVSLNARRNFKKVERRAASVQLNEYVGFSMFFNLVPTIRLRNCSLFEKKTPLVRTFMALKTLIRTIALRNKTKIITCFVDGDSASFSNCINAGNAMFYLEGGSKPEVAGAGWYVLLSTIQRAYEATRGTGLFVMGPVRHETLETPDWQGLAWSRQQCRVTRRPVETIGFIYAPEQTHADDPRRVTVSRRSYLSQLSMALKKNPRLVVANIKERIVFDLLNGVDTITQVSKGEFRSDLKNLDHGLHYSSSWTSEIKFGFYVVKKRLGAEFGDFKFIDIGCGKGKVQIMWEHLLKRQGMTQDVFGLDYYDVLIDTARANVRKALGKEGRFIHADATEFNYPAIGRKLIIYLYNPFDGAILARVLAALDACDVLIIYNNPEHADIVLHYGYRLVEEKKGFHPQAWTTVYERRSSDASRSQHQSTPASMSAAGRF